MVGSIRLWLIFRVVVPVVCFVATLVLLESPDFPRVIALFILWSVTSVAGDEFIYGKANEDGLFFRRYFRMQFLPWSAIESIGWTTANDVQFYLKNRYRFRRVLYAKSQQAKSFADLLGQEPDVVRWLTLVKPPTADGIELRGREASPEFLGRSDSVTLRYVLPLILIVVVVCVFLSVRSHLK